MDIDFELHTDAEGNITVSVVPDNGNTFTVPAGMTPQERDLAINAFVETQRALDS